jgi:hypothetical protein
MRRRVPQPDALQTVAVLPFFHAVSYWIDEGIPRAEFLIVAEVAAMLKLEPDGDGDRVKNANRESGV